MPSTSVLPSVDLKLSAGGNPIGYTTGATLTINQGLDDAFHDEAANWMQKTAGVRSWSVQADGLANASGGDIVTGHATGAALSVSIDGDDLKGLTEAGISLSLDVAEVVNATTGIDRNLDPAARSCEVSLSFDYTDPLATDNDAFDTLLSRLLTGGADVAVVISVGGLALAFDAQPSTGSLTKSAGDIVKSGVTLVASGAVTNNTTGIDAGITGLLSAFFATARATAVTALLGTGETGDTELTGSAFPSAISITAPFASQVTVSATLEGHGALTRAATAA